MPLSDKNSELDLAEQWELARRVFAWHQVFVAVENTPNQGVAKKRLSDALQRFTDSGGEASAGIDRLEHIGPALKLGDGRVVPYESGSALVDGFARQLACL